MIQTTIRNMELMKKPRLKTPDECFLSGPHLDREDESLIANSGCSHCLYGEGYEKYLVGVRKQRMEFNLAASRESQPFTTDNLHILHLPIRDEFGRVRMVLEEGAIHPSVGRSPLPCAQKELFLAKRRKGRSYVELVDILDGGSFRAPVDRIGWMPLVRLCKDDEAAAAAQVTAPLFVWKKKCFYSFSLSANARASVELPTERKQHLFYVLHSRLAHSVGSYLEKILKEKGVPFSVSPQECRDVRDLCEACKSVNQRKESILLKGVLKQREDRRKRRSKKRVRFVEDESRPSAAGGDLKAQKSQQQKQTKEPAPFNQTIFQDLKEMRTKGVGGFKYISVIVCGGTKKVSLHTFRKKRHAVRHLRQWVRRWEVRGLGKPLIVRTDNGGEFLGKDEIDGYYLQPSPNPSPASLPSNVPVPDDVDVVPPIDVDPIAEQVTEEVKRADFLE
uniref:Integrase catalytic domain-containing protein n=1 Tax=Chromera velia CCMP2878 TaxID=1169474 RepID=A0A0G4FUY0_9ALVE|eukprot:Cvel_18760.t1-p1 / transcript=Cvel_18760.t1 / gene=Cvel_18760 / organism=Chromera_velia_CCMP2878 / gene_product=hypothetical protein / transcript_product=hypothetical protein / location=Cvel_scaffold1574:9728-12150(+) / protein_length=446 / sequence_SO=supercontig / SO=protein_coding / is_pseudo=false